MITKKCGDCTYYYSESCFRYPPNHVQYKRIITMDHDILLAPVCNGESCRPCVLETTIACGEFKEREDK